MKGFIVFLLFILCLAVESQTVAWWEVLLRCSFALAVGLGALLAAQKRPADGADDEP